MLKWTEYRFLVVDIYDALVVAAALESSCKTLYSEDMANGQVIDGLTIRNPFTGL